MDKYKYPVKEMEGVVCDIKKKQSQCKQTVQAFVTNISHHCDTIVTFYRLQWLSAQ